MKPLYFNESDRGKKDVYKRAIDGVIRQLTNGRRVFDFSIYFSEVFHKSRGFDIIIANPPYVSAVRQTHEEKVNYKEHYVSAAGAYDIYVLFMEKSLRLVADKGFCCLITPNKYLIADYGRRIRQLLLAEATIAEIDDFGKCRSVFEASLVSTAICFYCRGNGTSEIRVKILSDDTVAQIAAVEARRVSLAEVITSDGAFKIYADADINAILDKISATSERLASIAKVRTGVMGFDYWKMNEYIGDAFDGPKIATNSYVGRYCFLWGKKVNLYDREVFEPRLDRACDLLSQNTINLFSSKKVVVRGVARRLTAALDEEGVGLLVAVHSVVADKYDNRFLLGLLNSALYNWIHLVQWYSARIPEGSLRYPVAFLQGLPVRKLDLSRVSDKNKHDQIVALVSQILAAKSLDLDVDTSTLEREIDSSVYELYDLTTEEIALVAGRVQ